MDSNLEVRLHNLEKQLRTLTARLEALETRVERVEDKAWPIHAAVNRIKRWKRGEWWWIDKFRAPSLIRMDNIGGKGRDGFRKAKTARERGKL